MVGVSSGPFIALECAFDMVDPEEIARRRQEHADHVEAELARRDPALTGEPDARDAADLGALCRSNRLERRRRAGRRAAGAGDERLHLAEDERAPAGGDQVDLSLARAEVALDQRVPELFEKLGRDRLAAAPGTASAV